MKKFEGKEIREVWDYRLSTASPFIDRRGGTWVVKICSKNNPDYVKGQEPTPPLEIHDTGIKAEQGDEYDTAKVSKCYEWLYSVRDKYAHPDIEKIKPLVKKINEANKKLAELRAV